MPLPVASKLKLPSLSRDSPDETTLKEASTPSWLLSGIKLAPSSRLHDALSEVRRGTKGFEKREKIHKSTPSEPPTNSSTGSSNVTHSTAKIRDFNFSAND